MSINLIRSKVEVACALIPQGKAKSLLEEACEMLTAMILKQPSPPVNVRDIVTENFSLISLHEFQEKDMSVDLSRFMDSLDVVEAVMTVEDALNIDVDDEILSNCSSLSDFISAFEQEYNKVSQTC